MSVPPNLKIGIPLIGKLEAPLSLDETSPHASALLIHYSTFGGLAPALPAPPAQSAPPSHQALSLLLRSSMASLRALDRV